MANLFPDIWPELWEPDFIPFEDRDTSRSGALQINSYDPLNQLVARASWKEDRPEYEQIEDHWFAHHAHDFHLYEFLYRKLRGLFVAVADGIATVYTLPAKSVAGLSIKHNGVVAGTQPTLLVGTGAEGEDQIQYTAPTKPAAGVVVTLDATNGRQKLEVNYEDALFPDRHFEATIKTVQLRFRQKVVA